MKLTRNKNIKISNSRRDMNFQENKTIVSRKTANNKAI